MAAVVTMDREKERLIVYKATKSNLYNRRYNSQSQIKKAIEN